MLFNFSSFFLERESGGRTLLLCAPLQYMYYNPTTNGGMQKWKLGRNTYTLRAHFSHILGADSHAQSVLINKNFCIGAQAEVY